MIRLSSFKPLKFKLLLWLIHGLSVEHPKPRIYKIFFPESSTNWASKGPDDLDNLRKLAEQFQKGAPTSNTDGTGLETVNEDDDEVPDLVAGETFEAAAEEGQKSS